MHRRALTDTFAISRQQACLDIRHYRDVAEQNLYYDAAQKAYLRTAGFKPAFLRDASERYLVQAAAVQNEWMLKDSTWFEEIRTRRLSIWSWVRSGFGYALELN